MKRHCFAAAKDKICFINTSRRHVPLFSLSFSDVYGTSSNILCCNVGNEEKKFNNIDAWFAKDFAAKEHKSVRANVQVSINVNKTLLLN